MIHIRKSPTADTRTCDYKNVSKETLELSSRQHILDVNRGLNFFRDRLTKAADNHDVDKITDIDGFHADFLTGFEKHSWWDMHKKLNRHHLGDPDGIPQDVNLIDVLDYITDCVMAGMARSGEVYEIKIDPHVLMVAFINTIKLLKQNVQVVE